LGKSEFYKKGYYAGLAPEPRFRKVLKIATKSGGKYFLDIGCGDGSFTILLKEALKIQEAIGIEISPEAVSILKEKGIKAYQLDIDENIFPFENDSFDFVYCGEIIEHLFDPDHLLEEIHRILKPNGKCIVTTPNLAGWPNRLSLLIGYQPYATSVSPEHEGAGKFMLKGDEGQAGHIRVFTLRALKELLTIHSFRIIQVAGCPVSIKTSSSRFLANCIIAIDKVISIFPSMSSRIIVVIEK